MRRRVLPAVSVNIRNIAVGGAGVGEVTTQQDGHNDLLGIATFVPFVIPGEVVSARVISAKKRHLQAELLALETESADRVTPYCPHFMICGGCELQHMSYPAQLEAKRKMIVGALRSVRAPGDVVERVSEVKPSEPFAYRHRVTLHLNDEGAIGFYRANSRAVVPIESCPVAIPAINEVLNALPQFGKDVRGKVTSIVLEGDESGVVAILKTGAVLSENEIQFVLAAAKKYFKNAKLISSDRELGGFGKEILELPLDRERKNYLQIPAASFSQVNWLVNQELVQTVVQLSNSGPGTVLADLFSGAGNFAIPLAKTGAKVIAVECDRRLIAFSRQNAFRLRVDNLVEFVEASVERFLHQVSSRKLDCIIADPPRSGLGRNVNSLPDVKRLLLVSCHLPSFARDVKGLIDNGWSVHTIQPFDMFAQTSYVEIVTLLERT